MLKDQRCKKKVGHEVQPQVWKAYESKFFQEWNLKEQLTTVWIVVSLMWWDMHVEVAQGCMEFFSFNFSIFSKISVIIMQSEILKNERENVLWWGEWILFLNLFHKRFESNKLFF